MYEFWVQLLPAWLPRQPAYLVLALIAALELTAAVGLAGWIVWQTWRSRLYSERRDRVDGLIDEYLTRHGSSKQFGHPNEGVPALRRTLADLPTYLVSEEIVRKSQAVDPESARMLANLYRDFGFLERDLQLLPSTKWESQIPVLRRLYVMGRASEAEQICPKLEPADHHIARLLAAQIATRVGCPDRLPDILEGMEFLNRMMEEPLRLLIETLEAPELRTLLTYWDEYSSPFVKRTILRAAVDRGVDGADEYIDKAARSENIEVRIGAAWAASRRETPEDVQRLGRLIEDEAWQVRAQALKAIGDLSFPAFVKEVAEATEDPSFWVRQNAARTLAGFDEQGIAELKQIVEHSEDEYAADAARQELQRIEQVSDVPL